MGSLFCRIFSFIVLLTPVVLNAQDEIDVIDTYEKKVSRSAQADTFYFTQQKQQVVAPRLDTLRTYDVFLEERITPFGIAYMCNGAEIPKKKYLEYKSFWNASGACKPCVLYTYDNKDQLKYIAFQYEDCLCGNYKELYPNGEIKLKGQFRENTTGNWSNLKGRNLCSIREGEWIYYTEDGTEEKRESYVMGKLQSTTYPTSTKLPSQPEGEESTRKGIFSKGKTKNSPPE